MHVLGSVAHLSKAGMFTELRQQLAGLLAGERDGLANCANLTALIHESLPALNWVGFYFARGEELVLGPFQGRVACVRIPMGKGVCGTAAERRETLIVADVHQFPGHIACDAASRSEIVVPLQRAGRIVGVLDLDSPQPDRFDQQDAEGLGALVQLLMEGSDFSGLVADQRDPARTGLGL
jgi:GAF domain-containing protein